MERKYQVFISSTFEDLKDERQAAILAILDAGHIPAGMELFPAGNESQLEVIKKWIVNSDVFMLILGGRYGSIEPATLKSYTQLEYEYALQIHKPIFAVVLSDSMLFKKASISSKEGIFERNYHEKYEEFKNTVLLRMTRIVNNVDEISTAVLSSLYDFSRNTDLHGWIRELSSKFPQTVFHKCYMCGKDESLPPEPNFSNSNSCLNELYHINRWHDISVKRPGYGSALDGLNINFELCDECLEHLINSLYLKQLIPDHDQFNI